MSASSSVSSPSSANSTTVVTTPWADPAMRRYKFWNREDDAGKGGKYKFLLEISPESIKREAKIISLSSLDDDANHSFHNGGSDALPLGSQLLQIGTSLADFEHLRNASPDKQPNVVFVSPSCPRASSVLPLVLATFPTIEWVHVRSAGIDFVESDEFAALTTKKQIIVTNAKGQFSSSLAEYALMACSYFAKDIPRLMEQKSKHAWQSYNIQELYVSCYYCTIDVVWQMHHNGSISLVF